MNILKFAFIIAASLSLFGGANAQQEVNPPTISCGAFRVAGSCSNPEEPAFTAGGKPTGFLAGQMAGFTRSDSSTYSTQGVYSDQYGRQSNVELVDGFCPVAGAVRPGVITLGNTRACQYEQDMSRFSLGQRFEHRIGRHRLLCNVIDAGRYELGSGLTLVCVPQFDLVPIAGHAGYFRAGQQVYLCPEAKSLLGGVIGAIIGFKVGQHIKLAGDTHLNALGTVFGYAKGSAIACQESSDPRVAGQTGVQRGDGITTTRTEVSGGQTTVKPSHCDLPGGRKVEGISDSECDMLGGTYKKVHPQRCVFEKDGKKEVVESNDCEAEALKSATRTEAKTTTVEVPPHCPVGSKSRNVTMLVVNAERREAFCGELLTALQKGEVKWEDFKSADQYQPYKGSKFYFPPESLAKSQS